MNFVDISGENPLAVAAIVGISFGIGYIIGKRQNDGSYYPKPGDRKVVFAEPDDKHLRSFAKNLKPHPDGCLQVIGHGSGKNKLKTGLAGDRSPITGQYDPLNIGPEGLKDLLIENPDYTDGPNCIQLLRCGQSDETFGKDLKKELNADFVEATSGTIIMTPFGQYYAPFGWSVY